MPLTYFEVSKCNCTKSHKGNYHLLLKPKKDASWYKRMKLSYIFVKLICLWFKLNDGFFINTVKNCELIIKPQNPTLFLPSDNRFFLFHAVINQFNSEKKKWNLASPICPLIFLYEHIYTLTLILSLLPKKQLIMQT